jgi:hypothetical protein
MIFPNRMMWFANPEFSTFQRERGRQIRHNPRDRAKPEGYGVFVEVAAGNG